MSAGTESLLDHLILVNYFFISCQCRGKVVAITFVHQTDKIMATIGATGERQYTITKVLSGNRLVSAMGNSLSINRIIVKDRIKSFIALATFLTISFWQLCHYAVGA
jgi:hypothetical protein